MFISYLSQQKVLRKILQKVFITKKFTRFKTSHILKIDEFEIPGNKSIGKLFAKEELLFLDQANSSSNLSWILILQFPIPRASLPPSPSLSNFTTANWNSYSTQSSSCSSSVSLFSPTPFDHTLPRVLDIQTTDQAKPIKFIIKLYADHNTLWVKHATYQKAESLRAFRQYVRQHSQQQLCLQYKVCWLLFKMAVATSFSQPYLYIQPLQKSPSKICSSTSVNFLLPIPPLLVHKIVLTIPL